MADAPLTPEDRDVLVAELALGLLDGEARAGALRQLVADPGFSAGMIDAWHQRLAPLYDEFAPVTPSEGIWEGIAARIGSGGNSLRQLRLWQGGAIAAFAIAASLAMVLLFRAPPPTPVPAPMAVAVAQLVGTPEGPVITARYDPDKAVVTLRVNGIKPDPLAPELWVIPADGKPRSLGLIPNLGEARIEVATGNRSFLADGSVLAVTMETATGAPHDAPSSTPVAAGKIVFF
jgi:anti-sigma-K factor RskA